MYCDDLRPAASASAKPALPASLRTATSSYGEARKSICALSPASHLSLIRSTIRSAGLGDYVDLSTGGCMRRTKLQIVDDARGLVGLSLLSPPAAVAPEPPPPPLCSLTSPQAGLTGAPSSAGLSCTAARSSFRSLVHCSAAVVVVISLLLNGVAAYAAAPELYELAAIVGGWRSDGARAAPAQPQI